MNENEFELRLDFQKESRDPARVFYSMGSYIDTFNAIDSSLVSLFGARIDSNLVLQDIETGSIKTRIRRMLESVDDEALKSGEWKKIVGTFLHAAKYRILQWCSDREMISDPNDVIAKARDISMMAESTNLLHIPAYTAFEPQALLAAVNAMHRAGRVLHTSDELYYSAGGNTIRINRRISLSQEVEQEFLTPHKDVKRQSCILVVKKPDYLGDSRWDFKLDSHPIQAHVRDADWLAAFRNRQFDLKPGDALKVTLEIQSDIDRDGNQSSTQYEVSEVRGIVAAQNHYQPELIELNGE